MSFSSEKGAAWNVGAGQNIGKTLLGNPEADENVRAGKGIGKTLFGNPEAAKILIF